MEHFSDFQINIISEISEKLRNKFNEYLNQYLNNNFHFPNDENKIKWYRYREDLKFLSKMEEFKGIVFVVTRIGEKEDFNIHLFSNGEVKNLIPSQFNSETTNYFERYFI